YVIVDYRRGQIPVYDPKFTTLFPRMWSNIRKGSADFYKTWGGPGVPVQVTDRDGKAETLNKPTFGENLKFFFTYQVNWMYLRYFMWNFSGRQDDIQSFGSSMNGNWITGIPFFDQWKLGHSTVNLPEKVTSRASHKYFMLPLILGLIGLFYQMRRDYKGNLVVIMLFLMTGLAIITYLNQQPYEPRERDYSYAGSFFAFSIWIGLGLLYLIDLLKEKLKFNHNLATIVATVMAFFLVPCVLAQQNWKDHDRSGKYSARDFSADYLNSCDKNAILFTNGDNDTFPLWYNQEVEGVRTDVRVVNLELAAGSWYIDQLFRKAYDSKPLPFSLKQEQYQPGSNDVIPFYDLGIKDYVDLKDLIDFIKSDAPETFVTTQSGEKVKFFPARKIRMIVDKDACIKNGIVPEYMKNQIEDTIYFTIAANQLLKNDVMMLDILASNHWKRPICFASPNSVHSVFAAEKYCYLEGWVYKFMPVKNLNKEYLGGMGEIDPIGSYNILMHNCKWGNLNNPKVYVDPESLNNSLRPKMNFVLVAQTLIDMNEKQKASALVDEYYKYFPDPKFPLDIYDIPYVEVYYSAGETVKANKMVDRMLVLFNQDINYYSTFKGESRQDASEEMQSTLQALTKLQYLTKEYKQDNLSAKAESILKRIQL
ncbi:MAG: DUF2723 domain-containing protein, partial [Bacteroidota bacterium]|nr:DUF2723 domain-containing protein [Bacteroidota bacterium]